MAFYQTNRFLQFDTRQTQKGEEEPLLKQKDRVLLPTTKFAERDFLSL